MEKIDDKIQESKELVRQGANPENYAIKLNINDSEITNGKTKINFGDFNKNISDLKVNNSSKSNELESNLNSELHNLVVIQMKKCTKCGLLEKNNALQTNFETESKENSIWNQNRLKKLIKEVNLINTKPLQTTTVIVLLGRYANVHNIKLDDDAINKSETGDSIKIKTVSSPEFIVRKVNDSISYSKISSLISLASSKTSESELESSSEILEIWERDSSSSLQSEEVNNGHDLRIFGSLRDCGKIHPGFKSEQDIKTMLDAALENSKKSKNARKVKSDIGCHIKHNREEIQTIKERELCGYSLHHFSSRIQLCSTKEILNKELDLNSTDLRQNSSNQMESLYREIYRLRRKLKKKSSDSFCKRRTSKF